MKPTELVSEPSAAPLSSPTLQSPLSHSSPPAQLQSPSGSICTESSSIASSAAANTHTISIPDHWRPEVEDCLRKKCLTPNARQEIIRTVASQLFAKSQKPNRNDCDQVARQLILKYPFTKDDLGCGYVSSFVVIDCYMCDNYVKIYKYVCKGVEFHLLLVYIHTAILERQDNQTSPKCH